MRNMLKKLFSTSDDATPIHFQRLFDTQSNPALLLSPQAEILYCNEAVCSMYGLSRAELLHQNYFLICHQHHIHPVYSTLSAMLTSPQTTQTTLLHTEPRRVIQWSATPYRLTTQDGYVFLQGMDVTTLTNASVAAKNLQSSIIDLLPNHHIFWKDLNSIYLGCNQAFSHSLGFRSPEDVIGKSDYDLPVKKENSDAYIIDDKEVMTSKKPKLNIEEPQALENGETRILRTSKIPLTDSIGEVYGVLAIYSDVTEQKDNEKKLIEANKKLEKAYQVKSEFIRNMSHDIRTPLSGILQTTRAISDGKISESDIPEYAFAMWEASNNLMDFFSHIIDVSRKEHFDFEDNVVKFDLHKLLANLKSTYHVIAKHKNVDLTVEHTPDVPQYLVGKHFRLHRILMNLLGNALKFTQKGSVRLIVEHADTRDDNVVLRFSIIDTGIGISNDKLALIFEPFTRLTPAFTGQYPGSGLGLHVVKEYVEKMQGEVYVESEENHGSIFTCIVPFKRPILNNDNDVTEFEEESPMLINQTASKEKSPGHAKNTAAPKQKSLGSRVLLVEDYILAQNIGLLILSEMGYDVDVASSGEEALALAKINAYDLIYIDIGLPDIDGIETVRRIRENDQNPNKDTFVAALTAHADDHLQQQCKQVGIHEIMLKPLSSEKALHLHRVVFKNDTAPCSSNVIDFNLWHSRLNNKADQIPGFFELLAESLPNDKHELITAYEKNDQAALKMITHKMKGGLKYCGCPALESAVLALEMAVKNKHTADMQTHYTDTLRAIDDVMQAYETFCQQ